MDIPAYTQQTATQARQYRHHRHHKQRQVASNGGTTVSYENQLVTASSEDELDDPDVVVVGSPEVVAAVAAIASSKAREMRNRNRSGSYSNLFDADFETALVTGEAAAAASSAPVAGRAIGPGASAHGKPSAGAALLAAAMTGNTENMYSNVPAAEPADANLHVYSNIIDERQQQREQANNVLSSTLLCDDLDLDDPVSASFVAAGHHAGHPRKSHGDGAEQVKSAERLRMLHDTTMIDTALDLDSLDGSSMGNNSQSCLVKAAGKASSTSTSNLPIV
ncbi:hypothetical protein KR018_003359 [Drosophila ironensis]|nr:hypothetical protein KR018_003359 [Drosophila ironensis]